MAGLFAASVDIRSLRKTEKYRVAIILAQARAIRSLHAKTEVVSTLVLWSCRVWDAAGSDPVAACGIEPQSLQNGAIAHGNLRGCRRVMENQNTR